VFPSWRRRVRVVPRSASASASRLRSVALIGCSLFLLANLSVGVTMDRSEAAGGGRRLAATTPGCLDSIWGIFRRGKAREDSGEDPSEILEGELKKQVRKLQIDDRTGKNGNKLEPAIRKDTEATALSMMTSMRALQRDQMQNLRKAQRKPPRLLQKLELEYLDEASRLKRLREKLQESGMTLDEALSGLGLSVATTTNPSRRTTPGLEPGPPSDQILPDAGSAVMPPPPSQGFFRSSPGLAASKTDFTSDGWWMACEDCRRQISVKFDTDLQDQLARLRQKCDKTRDEIGQLFQARIREAAFQHQRDNIQDQYHDFRRELELTTGQLLHETTATYQDTKQDFLVKLDRIKSDTASKLKKVGEELSSALESSRDMAFEKKHKLFSKKMTKFSKMMDKAVEKQIAELVKQYVASAKRKVSRGGGN